MLQLIREQASLAEDTLRKLKTINKSLNLPKLRRKVVDYEESIEKGQNALMELYEKFVSDKLSKEKFVIQKGKIMDNELRYSCKIEELRIKIANEENRKSKEKSTTLNNLSKYSNLEVLSYPVVQELISAIYIYDPDHIEVVWNFQDELLAIMEQLNNPSS